MLFKKTVCYDTVQYVGIGERYIKLYILKLVMIIERNAL
jgi:hypothetical protein